MKQMKPQKLHLNALTLLFAFLCASTIYAQQTTGDVPKQADATLGQVTTSAQLTPHTTDPNTKAGTPGATAQGGAIRVIDNKGTKKYLQVQNGLTQVTNTAPAGGIVTTWQLGGQLVDDTDIDFNAKALSFDNVLQVTGAPATSATLKAGTGTGWALLVRDENSGDIKKLLASDLIVSGHTVFTATAAAANGIATGAELEFNVETAGGLTGVKVPLPDYEKVWVYRNGAKLIADLDYKISNDGKKIELKPNATAPNNWAVYAGDVIEVQYFK